MITRVDTGSKEKRDGYIIGRDAFAKISAVEGIYLTKELRQDFKVFEENGLSPQDRRDAITKKYTR